MYKTAKSEEIAARIEQGEDLLLIDVREPEEWKIATIEGAQLLPLSQIETWWQDVPHDREVVVFCHHGGRSMQVCRALLSQANHSNLTNMEGGIDRWAERVDPTLARY